MEKVAASMISVTGVAILAEAASAENPWITGGALAAVVFIVITFLKFIGDQRKLDDARFAGLRKAIEEQTEIMRKVADAKCSCDSADSVSRRKHRSHGREDFE